MTRYADVVWPLSRQEAVLKDAHTRDVPKRLRPHPGPIGKGEFARSLGLHRALVDPIKTLGHPPRPRKRRR